VLHEGPVIIEQGKPDRNQFASMFVASPRNAAERTFTAFRDMKIRSEVVVLDQARG
jgi:hypothetical protein